MKLIDEKGRLFGKINVIDFLVILFFISFIPTLYLGYKISLRRSSGITNKVFTEFEISCKLIKVKPDVLKQIAVGDREIDENGQVVGEIIWLGEVSPNQICIDLGAGESLAVWDTQLKEIPAKLKVKAGIWDETLYYQDKQIMINSPFVFKCNKYTVSVMLDKFLVKNPIIVSTDGQFVEISCKLIKVKPDVLKQIAVGDREIDENGILLGEITWLGKTAPYKDRFNTEIAIAISNFDSELEEISARLKIRPGLKGETLYYKDKKVALDSYIDFVTPKYKIEVLPLMRETMGKKIDLNILLKNLDQETLKLISVGDKEIDESGRVFAEILKVGKVEANIQEINLGGGNFAFGYDEEKRQVTVRMRLLCEIDEIGQLFFKGNKVAYNSSLEFNIDEYSVRGKLTSILTDEKWMEVKVKFSGVIPELANVLSKGDIEKSPEGKIMARLNLIRSNVPSDVLTIRENKYITVTHPFQRDVEATLSLLCIEKEGVLYFKNFPVKIGNMVTFATDAYSITGIIVGMGAE